MSRAPCFSSGASAPLAGSAVFARLAQRPSTGSLDCAGLLSVRNESTRQAVAPDRRTPECTGRALTALDRDSRLHALPWVFPCLQDRQSRRRTRLPTRGTRVGAILSRFRFAGFASRRPQRRSQDLPR